jgi:hypothetical protein
MRSGQDAKRRVTRQASESLRLSQEADRQVGIVDPMSRRISAWVAQTAKAEAPSLMLLLK